MDLKGFVDKAKEAAAAVTEQAKSAMTTAPAPPARNVEAEATGEGGGLVVSTEAPAPAPAQGGGVAAIAGKISEITALGGEKLQELIVSFQQAQPALTSAGYELTEFEIELGVTPKLIPHFRHAARTTEDVSAAREMLRDNKLGQMMLGALLRAGDVHKQINVAGFGFSHIEIELGLIPSIRLQYKKD
jgi:hypothetical protein